VATKYTFTQGNTKPYLAQQIKTKKDLAPVNLTSASVAFYFAEQNARTPTVSAGLVTITDAANGKVEYRWNVSDLDKPGVYDAEFRITFSDGKVQSVITKGIVVQKKLG
jgi:hypothetical protein